MPRAPPRWWRRGSWCRSTGAPTARGRSGGGSRPGCAARLRGHRHHDRVEEVVLHRCRLLGLLGLLPALLRLLDVGVVLQGRRLRADLVGDLSASFQPGLQRGGAQPRLGGSGSGGGCLLQHLLLTGPQPGRLSFPFGRGSFLPLSGRGRLTLGSLQPVLFVLLRLGAGGLLGRGGLGPQLLLTGGLLGQGGRGLGPPVLLLALGSDPGSLGPVSFLLGPHPLGFLTAGGLGLGLVDAGLLLLPLALLLLGAAPLLLFLLLGAARLLGCGVLSGLGLLGFLRLLAAQRPLLRAGLGCGGATLLAGRGGQVLRGQLTGHALTVVGGVVAVAIGSRELLTGGPVATVILTGAVFLTGGLGVFGGVLGGAGQPELGVVQGCLQAAQPGRLAVLLRLLLGLGVAQHPQQQREDQDCSDQAAGVRKVRRVLRAEFTHGPGP